MQARVYRAVNQFIEHVIGDLEFHHYIIGTKANMYILPFGYGNTWKVRLFGILILICTKRRIFRSTHRDHLDVEGVFVLMMRQNISKSSRTTLQYDYDILRHDMPMVDFVYLAT